MDDGNPMIGLVILVILLIIKGIISNAKAAINNLNEMNIKKKADEGDKDSLLLMELMDRPERYIYAIDIIKATDDSDLNKAMIYPKNSEWLEYVQK